jgi:protein SCO1/2
MPGQGRTPPGVSALSVELSRRNGLALLALGLTGAGCSKPAALPALGNVGNFALQDQAGRPVTEGTFKGKVWAAAFFFTRCPTICPRITRRMLALQKAAAERHVPLWLVSFSVDPENDTPEVLRAYAKEYGADLASWSFLTGDLEVVRKTSESGFKLALDGKATPGVEGFGLFHGSHLVLLDGSAQIRGYYRTSEDEQMTQLLADAAALV